MASRSPHPPGPRQPSGAPSREVPLPARPAEPAPGARLAPHNPLCFGCADVEGGLGIVTWAGEGLDVLSRFDVRERHQGAPGLLFGGLLTAAFDDVLGMVPALLGRIAVTVDLGNDFRRPVPVETALWLRARLDGVDGAKMAVSGSAHLGDADGPLAARARGLWLEVGMEHFERNGRMPGHVGE